MYKVHTLWIQKLAFNRLLIEHQKIKVKPMIHDITSTLFSTETMQEFRLISTDLIHIIRVDIEKLAVMRNRLIVIDMSMIEIGDKMV